MALTRTGKTNYLRALVACEEYAQPESRMGDVVKRCYWQSKVPRQPHHLNQNMSLNKQEKSLLAVCLIATIIFTAAFADGEKFNSLVGVFHNGVQGSGVSVEYNNEGDERTSLQMDSGQMGSHLPQHDANQGEAITKFIRDSLRTAAFIGDMMKDGIITTTNDLRLKSARMNLS